MSTYKQQVVKLLKSFETGDTKPLASINPNKYVQHNLAVGDSVTGLRALLQALPKGSAKVNTVRVFQDGDFVFAHTEYDFFGPKVGFDIFRFEDGMIVEHWDNLQETAATPSPSGHTMIDGPTTASDLDKTEANKALMQTYMDDLLHGRRDTFASYFDGNTYIQHSPLVADGLTGLFAGLQALAQQGLAVKYDRVHNVLGEGNFVLVVAEGSFGGRPSSYYYAYDEEFAALAPTLDPPLHKGSARSDSHPTHARVGASFERMHSVYLKGHPSDVGISGRPHRRHRRRFLRNRRTHRPRVRREGRQSHLGALEYGGKQSHLPQDSRRRKQFAMLGLGAEHFVACRSDTRKDQLRQKAMTQMGTWMPFAKAALLISFTHTHVS